MTTAPRFDPHNAESQAVWAQWVTSEIIHLRDEVKHLHECIERGDRETKELVSQKASAAEELAESRHGQNLETLKRIGDTVQLLTTFRENATQKEIEDQAVQNLLRQQAAMKAKKQQELKSNLWKAVEYAGGAGIVTLCLAGIVSIARILGL